MFVRFEVKIHILAQSMAIFDDLRYLHVCSTDIASVFLMVNNYTCFSLQLDDCDVMHRSTPNFQ